MLLITDSKALFETFSKNLDWCEKFYCASAWAGIIPEITSNIARYRKKIKQMVIGIHFYQTDPRFIEKFLNSDEVKFIQQPEGTFHPKIYLFEKGFDWKLMIGSANLTGAAFTRNTEATCEIGSRDLGAAAAKIKALNLIKEAFKTAESFDQAKLNDYREHWNRQQPRLRELADNFGDSDNQTESSQPPVYQCETLKRNWNQYYAKICEEIDDNGNSVIAQRIALLDQIQVIFKSGRSYAEMTPEERRLIAGMPCKLNPYWGYFGSMKGAGEFHNLVNENPQQISEALALIPLDGEVIKEQFQAYMETYLQIPKKVGLATATRLLAMKRPDIFMCLSSKNKRNLCEEFKIKQDFGSNKNIDYNRYWDEIVRRIQLSSWWDKEPTTFTNEQESKTWKYRAAFIDSLFYKDTTVSKDEEY